MKTIDIRNLVEAENSAWYIFKAKYLSLLVKNKIKKNMKALDVGCGTGYFMRILKKEGYLPFGVDINSWAFEHSKKRGFIVKKANINKLPFRDKYFDCVIALELIEHLDNPQKGIGELKRVLKKDGLLIISVPAFSFLWSGLDVRVGHKRRYTKNLLLQEIKGHFKPVKVSYIFMTVFPLYFMLRLIRNFIIKKSKNASDEFPDKKMLFEPILRLFFKIEYLLIKQINLPVGIGIMGSFKKC